jgi:hypothetical protein
MARLFVTDINLNKNELQNARIQGLASAPTGAVNGQIYYDTSNNTMYYYNGLASPDGPWVAMNASTEVVQDIIGAAVEGGVGLTRTYVDSTGITTIDLDNTAVTAGSYGSTTKIPTFTVDAQGRLTAAGEADLATQLDLGADNAHGGYKLDLLTDSIKFVGGEGIDTTYTTADNILHTITIAGEDATTSNKGIASFADADFTVTTGAVTIKNVNLTSQTTGNYVATVTGTANEIEITGEGTEGRAAVIGLPNDVTITNNLTVGGDLNVTGTINSVNTTQVNIVDNKINLNTDHTGPAIADAGLRVERGDSADVEILWREAAGSTQSATTWGLTNDGTNYHSIARKFSATVGDGTLTQIPVTHNLGSRTVVVNVYDSATYDTVECDVVRTSTTVVTLGFTVAPASGAYTVVIVG